MPYIGQPIAWTPCAYCNLDGRENPKSTRARNKVRGRIVWINELHHFFSGGGAGLRLHDARVL